jgi:transcriptional regulator with XRE-family HTH domain
MGRANASACYRELGAELRKRREAANVTAARIADDTGWDRTKVSRIESGHADISTVDLILYLGACGIYAGAAQDVIQLCRTAMANQGYWLERSLGSLIFHESTADRSIDYEPFTVPGLLQTRAYARRKIARSAKYTSVSVDDALRVRLERQAILRRPRPAESEVFLHERALRTEVGNAAIMHEQLLHIVIVAALANVTLRVIPEVAGDEGVFGGPCRLFEFRKNDPLVYQDGFIAGVFIDDADVVGDHYRYLVPELRAVALDPEASRAFVAGLADEYDRRNVRDDGRPQSGRQEQLC